MVGFTADIRDKPGKASAGLGHSRRRARGRAAFAPTLALTVILAFAWVTIAIAVILLVNHPKPLGPVLPEQNQDAETQLYLLAFFVILPLAILAGPRLADAIAAGPNEHGLPLLTGLLAATLAAAILLVKLSEVFPWGDGVGVVLVVALIWSAAAAATVTRAARPDPWPALLRVTDITSGVWIATGLLVFGTLLAVTSLKSIDPFVIGVGAIAVGAIVLVRERVALPRPRGRWGIAIDLAIIAIVMLAVPDLVVFRPEDATSDIGIAIQTGIIKFHQNFLLGPANEVLGGDAMLVDTASQYGVGSIYFLGGWFQLAPIGYGTFGFLSGAMAALLFAAGYCVLRMAGTSRLLAGPAIGVGVIALVFNLDYGIGGIPQQGPLRFGMPMAVILFAVVGARWPRHARTAWAAALAVVALSSIWALEAFAYTLAVFAAVTCLEVALMSPGDRLRRLGRQLGLVIVAGVCAHLLLAALTLTFAGQLPDWGQYLAYLRRFVIGPLGDFTYDISPWSPGLGVGATYLASAAAIVQLVRRRPDLAKRERAAIVALAGTTAYGIALFSYFDNRSADNIVAAVALPALLAGVLWLGFLLRSQPPLSRLAHRAILAFNLSIAALILAVGWSAVGERFPRSALAHVPPGGSSVQAALQRLWHPPPLDSRASLGQQLLDAYMPDQSRPLVLVDPDLTTEILIRSRRTNELPLGDAWEDSFVPGQRLPGLREAVDQLRAGDRVLTEPAALEALARFRKHPEIDPLTASDRSLYPGVGVGILPAAGELARLQLWALKRIGERFRLGPISPGNKDLIMVELAPRGQPARSAGP